MAGDLVAAAVYNRKEGETLTYPTLAMVVKGVKKGKDEVCMYSDVERDLENLEKVSVCLADSMVLSISFYTGN